MKYEGNTPAARAMRKILTWMLFELENNFHEVVLVPSDCAIHNGQKLRALQSANAAWYSEFSQQYANCRGLGPKRMKRARTFIRKDQTEDTLRRMIAGNFAGVQAQRLVDFVERFRSKRRFKRQSAVRMKQEFGPNVFDEFPF